MAFIRMANAKITKASLEPDDWNSIRAGALGGKVRISHEGVNLSEYSPDKFLLTHCFPAGHKVLMGDGTEKPIEEIEVGDRVVTHLGNVKPVNRLMTREVDEDLVVLSSASLPDVACTGEHPFYILREKDTWCDVFPSYQGEVKCTFGGKKVCSENTCSSNGHSLEWIDASDIQVGDRTYTPTIYETRHAADLTANRMRLLGYYVAEGHVSNNSKGKPNVVAFSIHEDEVETLGAEISRLMKAEFGITHHSLIRQKDRDTKGVTMSFSTVKWAPWFLKHSGTGSRIKKLSSDVVYAPPKWQLLMMGSWINGDGSYDAGCRNIRLATTSDDLASQAMAILDRMGIHSRLQRYTSPGREYKGRWIKESTGWHVDISGSYATALQEVVLWELTENPVKKLSTKGRYRYAASTISKVENVGRKPFKGTVYNFSVQDDESYVVNRQAVHNCTIIASVDVDTTGPTNDKGWHYYITPETEKYINSNSDSWERDLLLATFSTFRGAENYCFGQGTPVLMGDGTYKPIDSLIVGDLVVTHTGKTQAVTRVFKHDVNETVHAVKFGKHKEAVLVTGEHPFRCIDTYADPIRRNKKGKVSSSVRYRKDQTTKALRGEKHSLKAFTAEAVWKNASALNPGAYTLGPENRVGTGGDIDRAVILGYYLAEGCQYTKVDSPEDSKGVVITPGIHERYVVDDLLDRVARAFPGTSTKVEPTSTSTWRVELRGTEIGPWLLRMGGQHAANKKISTEVLGWSRDSLLAMFASWMGGDGSLHNRAYRLHGVTVSKALGQQMLRVATLCGLKASLTFVEINKTGPFQNHHYRTANGWVEYQIKPNHDVWELTVSREYAPQVFEASARWKGHKLPATRKRAEFTQWENKRAYRVASNDTMPYSGKVYNIEVEGDNSYVIYPGVAVHNCEHIQIPELSKGKILDAVARDIGDSVYVDILVATNRKHTDIIEGVESGELSTLSMGCTVEFTLCTKCGNIAHDDTDMCACLKYAKGNHFYDGRGTRRKIAELCGHKSDPDSVSFIEASWVANPAFKGAVVRGVLDSEEVEEAAIKAAFEMDRIVDTDAMQKAASATNEVRKAFQVVSSFIRSGQFDFSDDPDAQEPGTPAEDQKNLLDELGDDVKDFVRTKVRQELREEVETGGEPTPYDPNSEDTNDNLVQSAEDVVRASFGYQAFKKKFSSYGNDLMLYRLYEGLVSIRTGGWKSLTHKGFNGREILALSFFIDQARGKKDPLDKTAYDAISKLGGTSSFADPMDYLTACGRAMGVSRMSSDQAKALIYKGQLFSYGTGA